MQTAGQNSVVELPFVSSKSYARPFHDVAIEAAVEAPDGGTRMVPGYWGGENRWYIRYSSDQVGLHKFQTICSDSENNELHGQSGTVQIVPYEGNNPLYQHGPVRAADNDHYLEHQDGTPFFWLGDTWWMGLTTRLPWPDGFKRLTSDRVEKGFSVVQIVAGLYPDMEPFDDRGANEAGFPWQTDFSRINPAYFNYVDHRIEWLVEAGLVPCIVGCWGFFLDFAGEEVIRQHWDYLVARYGAFPVVWCMAGEAVMPFYNHADAHESEEAMEAYKAQSRKGWTE